MGIMGGTMNIPTPDQVEKLPKWAQEYIKDLDRRVVIAERTLNKYVDSQTPSNVYYEDMVCVGGGSPEFKTKYIQTSRMTFEHEGVQLDIYLRPQDGINLQWSTPKQLGSGEVAMIPVCFNKVRLVSKENMR